MTSFLSPFWAASSASASSAVARISLLDLASHADHFVQQQIVETPIEIPDIVALSGELSKLRIEVR